MLKRLFKFLLPCLFALTPLVVQAANTITAVTAYAHRPMKVSIPITAWVTGDDDSDCTVRIFYRQVGGSATYDSGMVMPRRIGLVQGHEGRILWLGVLPIQWYVKADDPDGGSFSTSPVTTSLQGIRGRIDAGQVFYVNQNGGDDSFDGTLPEWDQSTLAGPTQTIGQAHALLLASDSSGSGGIIRVLPGVYYEQLHLTGGTDGYYRTLEGTYGNAATTIIDGSHKVMGGILGGQYWNGSTNVPLHWAQSDTLHRVADGWPRDSIWFAYVPTTAGLDSMGLLVLNWDEYLPLKTTVNGLHTNSRNEVSGWVVGSGGDTLFIQRRNGTSPANAYIHMSRTTAAGSGISISNRNWRIANLTLRGHGYASAIHGGPGTNGAGIRINSSGVVIDSCTMYANEGGSVYAPSSAAARVDSVTVARCSVNDIIGGFRYATIKAYTEEGMGQLALSGAENLIWNNTVTGTFNGIGIGGNAAAADSGQGSWCEVSNNRITGVVDDGIEYESCIATNALVVNNQLRNFGHGLAFASGTVLGPTFWLYNTAANPTVGGACIKTGNYSRAPTFLYHNTLTTSVAGTTGIGHADAVEARYVVALNNILIGNGTGGYVVDWPATASLTDTLNWNMLDSLGTTRLIKAYGTFYSLVSIRQAYNWEKNGLVGHAAFVDSSSGNYRLTGVSAAIHNACRIPGVNTGIGGARYISTAPSMGAWEYLWPPTARLPWWRRFLRN